MTSRDYHHEQQQNTARPFVSLFVNHIKTGCAEDCRHIFAWSEKKFHLDPDNVSCFQWHIPLDVKVTSPESLTRIPIMVRTEWESVSAHDRYVFERPHVGEAVTLVEPFLEAHFVSIFEKISPVDGVKYDYRNAANRDRVVSVIHRTCKAESKEEFREILIKLAEACRAKCEGNILYDVNSSLDPEVPNNFTEYCLWDSIDSYDLHFDNPDIQAMLAALRELQVEAPQTRLWKFFNFGDIQTDTGEFRPLHH
mmetsp:Transcript_23174/g.33238  ORF Transcript_23174/g.33238 Transcript_23174/m.33238 type:complete len:252 (+) Transcript_23174:22-777(+)